MAANLDDIELISCGKEDQLDICLKEAGKINNDPLRNVLLPNGLPPITNDSLEEELLSYLDAVEDLPIHDYKIHQKYIELKPDDSKLMNCQVRPCAWELNVQRDIITGELTQFTEICIADVGNSANSMSMNRMPVWGETSIKGNSSNLPFWPAAINPPEFDADAETTSTTDVSDLRTCAPGLSRGIQLDSTPAQPALPASLNVTELFSSNMYTDYLASDSDEEEKKDGDEIEPQADQMEADVMEKLAEDVQEKATLTPAKPIVLKISEVKTIAPREADTEWAERLDVSQRVADFHERVPDMAYQWPFELDPFQQQAVLCLENHENVFVAAHTSAGKTVVAEYAIALCRKHMTRAIYTSPIKALSNQKFRDFKLTFEDVGLITGDIQIKPEAACLIMTTEILRSMLYGGSDVIRDVEWVIFDEVHYINDSERGVVWEEVLIMLPEHVNIILLSATVPNYMSFADWVGRTKKRKVYVVCTYKRPVPLEHYLYTGNSIKTSNEMFLLVDANSKLQEFGYKKACAAKKERESNLSKTTGAKGPRQGARGGEEKSIWLSVIDMLKKKEKLPAVAFTFSKKRIKENTSHLGSVDLTTSTEKSHIRVFIKKSIDRLKGSDKNLPQVSYLTDLLRRGIGIHHGGVLPILKEIVELLFQQGLLKILFATETFAMGVNMPARTVVFDSTRKYDGGGFRDLKSAEYIQMAGRAGRRGLDTTGTVIILCKGDVPELSNLNTMMLGKMTELESKFRLTYTMMLNLLRVEKLRIQDMLKRSFSEFYTQRDENKNRDQLHKLRGQVKNLQGIDCFYCGQDIESYYTACKNYCELRHRLMSKIATHPSCVKYMSPGRVVILSANQINATAVVLATNNKVPRTYKLLVLTDRKESWWSETLKEKSTQTPVEPPIAVYMVKPAPSGNRHSHAVIDIVATHVSVITTSSISIPAPQKIIDDYSKRQIPRFRDAPPGSSVVSAIEELLSLNNVLSEIEPVSEFRIRDMEMAERFNELSMVRATLESFVCLQCTSFQEHFVQVKTTMKVKDEFDSLKFRLSDASLLLLPEYRQRLDVLKELQYINSTQIVQLKGRVACEIRQQELLVTELIFENVLSDLHYTEIAALLSCIVFEQKNCSEPNLAPCLEKGVKRIKDVATYLGEVQQAHITDFIVQDYVSAFRFGLVKVVFEWARGMPFIDISKLTDVQEGIIVRCIQRLDELLRNIRDAARIIGDPVLTLKMEEASQSIKRDIVFAASLYTH